MRSLPLEKGMGLENPINRGAWWATVRAQLDKKPPAMQETLVRFLGQENPQEKG